MINYSLELSENAISGASVVDELIPDLVDDVLDDVDVDIAGAGGRHLFGKSRNRGTRKKKVRVESELNGVRFELKEIKREKGRSPAMREKVERGGASDGTERENREWNINRFASVFMLNSTWRPISSPIFRNKKKKKYFNAMLVYKF